jgi:hypothetical protein
MRGCCIAGAIRATRRCRVTRNISRTQTWLGAPAGTTSSNPSALPRTDRSTPTWPRMAGPRLCSIDRLPGSCGAAGGNRIPRPEMGRARAGNSKTWNDRHGKNLAGKATAAHAIPRALARSGGLHQAAVEGIWRSAAASWTKLLIGLAHRSRIAAHRCNEPPRSTPPDATSQRRHRRNARASRSAPAP